MSVDRLVESEGKRSPITASTVKRLISQYPTPIQFYDEDTIKRRCQNLKDAFSWVNGFTNFFAVKATPNPAIMRILHEQGFGFDCSSEAELILCEAIGCMGEQLMFTSNNTPAREFRKALELGAIINLDDITHIEYVEELNNGELPKMISFRYNPGPTRTGNVIIGEPSKAKFGLTKNQLIEAYGICKAKGLTRFGLHTMVVSNCLDVSELVETAQMVFSLAEEIFEKHGIVLEMVNLGGGFGVSYKVEDNELDVHTVGEGVRKCYNDMTSRCDKLKNLRVFAENGRYLTGPSGCIVTRVIHQKMIYKNYIGVDANMANLMRPGMYGAYHHMSCVAVEDTDVPEDLPKTRNIFDKGEDDWKADKKEGVYDVVGGLCENNDKLAIDRYLGYVNIGDLIVIHDTGAHGHSMGFNYNGKTRSAEILMTSNGNFVEIRRKETMADLFRTLTDSGAEGRLKRLAETPP